MIPVYLHISIIVHIQNLSDRHYFLFEPRTLPLLVLKNASIHNSQRRSKVFFLSVFFLFLFPLCSRGYNRYFSHMPFQGLKRQCSHHVCVNSAATREKN